jgi:hypothetical protein
LLLLSSSKYADRALDASQVWALSEDGRLLYDDLIHDLRLPKPSNEIALILAALLSHVRLGFSPSQEQCIKDFSSLLRGSPSRSAQETLKHMTYSFRNVLVRFSMDSEMILQLLEDVIDINQSTLQDGNTLPELYWTRRLFPLQDHDAGLAILSVPGANFQSTGISSLKKLSTENAGKDIAMTQKLRWCWKW